MATDNQFEPSELKNSMRSVSGPYHLIPICIQIRVDTKFRKKNYYCI
jgi:hypothetical protein